MSWPAALALAIGLALFAAAFVIGLAKTQPRTPDTHHVAPLRAVDATDQLQPGDDGQFGRWHLPFISRLRDNERDAETQTTHSIEGERS